ncbi:nuclear receptor ROR-beta-like isoform X1 [Crassostrea virginica]
MVKSGVMEPFVLEQNFLEYTNSILHPKKYFSHLYQGSVPEFDTNFQAQTHKLVQGNQGVQRTAKSSLDYRYGLSIGQLIERINTKVEVSELDIALEDCEIKATAPEIEIPPITDIKTLLSVETDIITEVKCVEEEADSTMSVEVTMKKERRWALGTQNPCQVCGDKAAGFYCGAFVCEACKKFFMRASRQQKIKYTCLKAKKCRITKESRVQCQYCRFQKCLSLNMSIPGQKNSLIKEESGISNIPCQVCNAPSSGFHFGALTCEGCKGFFRRIAKEKGSKPYRCSKSQNCVVTTGTRNLCRACRYQKCLDIGMSIEASRIGRQPNSVKHAINLELQKAKSLCASSVKPSNIDFRSLNNPGLDFNTSPAASSDVGVSGTNPDDSQYGESDQSRSSTGTNSDLEAVKIKQEPMDYDLDQSGNCCQHSQQNGFDKDTRLSIDRVDKMDFSVMEKNVEEINRILIKVGSRGGVYDEINKCDFSNRISVWRNVSEAFNMKSGELVAALKMFPVFKILELDDRITLVQDSIYSMAILNFSRLFNVETKEYSFFGWSKEEEKKIIEFYPELKTVQEDLLYVGDLIKTVAFDDIELTCLTGLLCFNADACNLKKRAKVEESQKYIMSFLEMYEEKKYNNWELRFGMLVLRIGDLMGLNQRHFATMTKMFRENPDLEISPLMREVYHLNPK